LVASLIGLGTNPPLQLGQTLSKTSSTQEQILASLASGGRALPQFSHVGLSSSMSCFRLAAYRQSLAWVS
jgi:hypothetical protein